MSRQQLIGVIGCTGCGKGSLGLELARRTGGEIVSLDSMKIYRRMDIGTAKPSAETRRAIPHHLIDVVEPSESFSVAEYVSRAERAISNIVNRGRLVFLVGGTALYLKSLISGLFEGPGADRTLRARLHEVAELQGTAELHKRLQKCDAEAAERIHPNDLRRIVRALEVFELTGQTISSLQVQWHREWDRERKDREITLIGLRRGLGDQHHRTNERVRRMIQTGLVSEVESLLAESKPLSETARRAVGYAEIIEYLEDRATLADAIEMIKIKTRQFAKAQRTWFQRFCEIEWIDLEPSTTTAEVADELLQRREPLWSM